MRRSTPSAASASRLSICLSDETGSTWGRMGWVDEGDHVDAGEQGEGGVIVRIGATTMRKLG